MEQKLRGPVVGTLMSNLGLELAFKAQGVPFERVAVGDRYVLARLHESRGVLGGETSGHVICLDRTTTGDGIVSALQVLAAMHASGSSLHELRAGLEKYPQVMINVRVARRFDPLGSDAVRTAVRNVERALGARGRVVLRPSGTEPLIRVMVEGEDAGVVRTHAEQLAEAVTGAAPSI
jgi:phosphoglucosamine mutase